MIKALALYLLSANFLAVTADKRTYVDSNGITHNTEKDKPKIVTWAFRAVSMSHYGLDETQLLGTYGEWANSGSDWNSSDPTGGSSFPADPSPEEIELLQKVTNLSPGCYDKGYCTEFDIDAFKALNADELLIHGYRGSPWAVSSIITNITAALGKSPIFLELSQEGGDKCQGDAHTTCAGLSMIDVIEEHLELAQYLNLDIPESLNDDRKALCKSSKKFQKSMKTAQEKGIRILPAYIGGGDPKETTSYIADVKHDMVLRMFEELGAPILHNDLCDVEKSETCKNNYFWEYIRNYEYFTGCNPENVNENCNDETLYPVDVWLYDHRTTQSITDPTWVKENFPDKAMLKGQVAVWPIGGRIVTPRNAAKILDIVGKDIDGFDRVRPRTDCTKNVKVASKQHKIEGIEAGEYACFKKSNLESKYRNECSFTGEKILKLKSKSICDPRYAYSLFRSTSCEERCVNDDDCSSFQVGESMCVLFDGGKALTAGKHKTVFKKIDCYTEKDGGNSGSFKRNKKKMCRPEALLSIENVTGEKKCKEACLKNTLCKAYQMAKKTCTLHSAATVSERNSRVENVDDFSCAS